MKKFILYFFGFLLFIILVACWDARLPAFYADLSVSDNYIKTVKTLKENNFEMSKSSDSEIWIKKRLLGELIIEISLYGPDFPDECVSISVGYKGLFFERKRYVKRI